MWDPECETDIRRPRCSDGGLDDVSCDKVVRFNESKLNRLNYSASDANLKGGRLAERGQ